jgi:Zn-dependent protease
MVNLRISPKERMDIIISWLTISIAFALVLDRGFLGVANFVTAFPISLVAVGTGFVLHELAHKYTALHYKAWAEFRAWNAGLVLALASGMAVWLGLFGFIFAAPGAVYIYGNITNKQNGIISVAGPVTNILVGFGFAFLSLFFSINSFFSLLLLASMKINFFLALFNMLPIFVLDGAKVFRWDPKVWAVVFFLSAYLVYFL